MSLLSRLGYSPEKKENIVVPSEIHANEISIVVPVKDNQKGVTSLLNILEKVTVKENLVKEVVIVDNLSLKPIDIGKGYSFPVILTSCNIIGPAAARNKGASICNGTWLLFLDSDCIPSETTVSGYLSNNNNHVAYAGNIHVISNGKLSNYYETQEILLPPEAIDRETVRPDYLVTANCLINKDAFEYVHGFDESFKQAGGEDIDLAFRLLEIGCIGYQWNSIVFHNFDDGLSGFVKRFIRYGKGNEQLSKKYGLKLSPRIFLPVEKTITNILLAFLQHLAMCIGYYLGSSRDNNEKYLDSRELCQVMSEK